MQVVTMKKHPVISPKTNRQSRRHRFDTDNRDCNLRLQSALLIIYLIICNPRLQSVLNHSVINL